MIHSQLAALSSPASLFSAQVEGGASRPCLASVLQIVGVAAGKVPLQREVSEEVVAQAPRELSIEGGQSVVLKG